MGVAALSEEEVRAALADLPGWRLGRGEIVRQYKFPTFREAIEFIVRLAEKAEAADHHPDLENHYNRVRVALHTWSENAITEKDLALAREIESVAEPGE
jgi:4a-hydroxytetrahydrobiopterin dehydratase